VDDIDVVVDGTEPSEEDASSGANNNEDSGSDSDQEDFLLSGANGVGGEVSGDIREYIIENRVTVDWRSEIDGEEWREMEAVVTDEEAEQRVEDLYGEIPSGVYTVAKQEVEEGNTEKAMTLIEDFE
jgi:hypothetical protein